MTNVIRTTVSIDEEVFALAKKRMAALRIRKFSRYVELLLEKDAREGGSLTIIKEESPEYAKKSRVLRIGKLPGQQQDRPKQSKGRKGSPRRNPAPKKTQAVQEPN